MKQLQIRILPLVLFVAIAAFSSCNKDVPEPTPAAVSVNAQTPTLGDIIARDTSFTFLRQAITNAGMWDAVSTSTNNFTIFAPNNAAFRLSGIPSTAVINALPLTQLVPLIQYHVLGFTMQAELIPETFPNYQALTMFTPPGAPAPFVRVSNFPSRRGTSAWVNNIPVLQTNILACNGVMHRVAALVAPPSQTLSQLINADTSLSFLRAAITRADEGSPAASTVEYLLNLPIGPNFTVFAPNNNAFRALLGALGAPPVPQAFAALPVQTVRAIVFYHVLGTRVFSPNLPATAANVPTLLTSAVPGTILSVSTAGVKGLANATASGFVTTDRHALNGSLHIINQVLRFQ